MFDKSQFSYNAETHLGFYKGKLVPSTTQLLELFYPINNKIKKEILKKAADRGTLVHNNIEDFNNYFITNQRFPPIDNDTSKEIKNYYSLLKAYDLRPIYAEQMIFLLDENGELICYGHYDFVLECMKTNELFNCLECYLFDAKTTSTFDKKKTKLQTQIYRVACNQLGLDLNGKTCGMWLREDNANIYPFEEIEDKKVIALCKVLREQWNGNNN